jgi:hypothetical protein
LHLERSTEKSPVMMKKKMAKVAVPVRTREIKEGKKEGR